ncbi:MAG: hypothetical protein ACLP4V_31365, partial [Methylocella sp.]
KTSCPIRRCAMTASNLDGQNGIMGSTPPQASQGTCAQVSKHFGTIEGQFRTKLMAEISASLQTSKIDSGSAVLNPHC